MGYIEESLMQGEQVVYEARFHYFMYWRSALLTIVALALPFIPIGDTLKWRLIFAVVLLFLAGIWYLVVSKGKKYVLTNKRVIEKHGIIQRSSKELMLRKCESVEVRQSVAGRLFGYGTVIVTTGEDTNAYDFIMSPVRFSTKINEQIDLVSQKTNATAALD